MRRVGDTGEARVPLGDPVCSRQRELRSAKRWDIRAPQEPSDVSLAPMNGDPSVPRCPAVGLQRRSSRNTQQVGNNKIILNSIISAGIVAVLSTYLGVVLIRESRRVGDSQRPGSAVSSTTPEILWADNDSKSQNTYPSLGIPHHLIQSQQRVGAGFLCSHEFFPVFRTSGA